MSWKCRTAVSSLEQPPNRPRERRKVMNRVLAAKTFLLMLLVNMMVCVPFLLL